MASSKLLTVLICTLGFTYQAGQVCLAYFSYPSSSSIDLTKSRDLYVPSLSYCISHHSSDPGETIADIDERMATWAALVICKIRVLGPNYSLATYDCQNVSQVVTRVLGILWCMQYQNGDMKTLRALATQDNVMVLGIKQHMLTKHAILFLHSSDMGISRRSQMVTIQDGHHFVHFKKLGVTRLPAPYGGRCRNYQQDGFTSAGDCLDQCIVKQAMKAFQLWPREVAASGQQHVAMLLNGSVMALEKCSNHCQEADCQVDNYIVDSSFLKLSTLGHTVIEIKASADFDFKSTESAKFALIEFICYTASLATLWFGGSVLTLSSNVLRKKFERRSKFSKHRKI